MTSRQNPNSHIDLGLAILSATTPPSVRRSLDEIAAYCGCSDSMIWLIEKSAIHKLKKAIFMRRDPMLLELVFQVLGREVKRG